jgi:adenosine 3'-phospho 5'-phosphosulfate transporter B3
MRDMRRNRQKFGNDDADVAAGGHIPAAPGSMSTVSSVSDIEFFEDLVSDPVLVLGMDVSHFSRTQQFLLCASGVFFFSLLYGFLQELISVQLCSRQLGLFLATFQFTGYTLLSWLLRTFVYKTQRRKKLTPKNSNISSFGSKIPVPFKLYLGLSLLRAVDLGMTNLAMQYINYPAKTLMKSSRVVFTMIFGVVILKKTYKFMDYFVVMCMVVGLVIFMHADANSSAVFQPIGVIMLVSIILYFTANNLNLELISVVFVLLFYSQTASLLCDGAITNMSENIMSQFGVGQDEFIFRMYSVALIAIAGAATAKGDLRDGILFLMEPGTYAEQLSNVPLDDRTWSCSRKLLIMLLFSSMGFFGSSCSAAITKNFGALAMSITSTARKATTLFLSFLLFDNKCTYEHFVGIAIFISALTAKSMRRKAHHGLSAAKAKPGRSLEFGEMGGEPSSSSFDGHSLDRSDRSPSSLGHLSRREGRRRSQADNQAVSASPTVRYHVV